MDPIEVKPIVRSPRVIGGSILSSILTALLSFAVAQIKNWIAARDAAINEENAKIRQGKLDSIAAVEKIEFDMETAANVLPVSVQTTEDLKRIFGQPTQKSVRTPRFVRSPNMPPPLETVTFPNSCWKLPPTIIMFAVLCTALVCFTGCIRRDAHIGDKKPVIKKDPAPNEVFQGPSQLTEREQAIATMYAKLSARVDVYNRWAVKSNVDNGYYVNPTQQAMIADTEQTLPGAVKP